MAALALVWAIAPVRAEAWADAAVRSVEAQVVLAPDGTARVTLVAIVRVHGGWLEGIELAGLDPDLVLAEDTPPWATDEAGGRWAPSAEILTGGRVLLAFGGHSPRRGRLTIGLTYHTNLAHRATAPVEGEELVRVGWTMPGWRSGLDGVEVEVIAPRGSRFGPRDENDSGASLETSREEVEGGTLLRWRRAHLPRTVAWTVAVDVPASAMVPELRAPPVAIAPPPRAHGVHRGARPDPLPFWLALSLVIAALSAFKLFAVQRLAKERRTRARGLVGSPLFVRGAAIVLLAPIAAVLGPSSPEVALLSLAVLALFATFRPAAPPRAQELGAWRPLDARWLRAMRRARWTRPFSPWTLADATTPLGALVAMTCVALPLFADVVPIEIRLSASALALPVLLGGTRLAFPSGPQEAAIAILRACRSLRGLPDGVALRPVAYVDVRGEIVEVRARTILERRPHGLLRLDLALLEAERAGGYERALALIVVTRDASPAELALATKVPELAAERSPGGRRVARIGTVRDLAFVVDALRECPEAPMPARGTPAPQETVHDLPSPQAVGM